MELLIITLAFTAVAVLVQLKDVVQTDFGAVL